MIGKREYGFDGGGGMKKRCEGTAGCADRLGCDPCRERNSKVDSTFPGAASRTLKVCVLFKTHISKSHSAQHASRGSISLSCAARLAFVTYSTCISSFVNITASRHRL